MISHASDATAASGVTVLGPMREGYGAVLSPGALEFIAALTRRFREPAHDLLVRRRERQSRYDRGVQPGFLPDTKTVRSGDWTVAAIPEDLLDRRVEITGPVDRKMIINALNSGANVFMADFEDSNAPTWDNVVVGQINLRDAVAGSIEFVNGDGRRYRLNEQTAVLMVRPRGWHLFERHVLVDGRPVPAGLFDLGLYLYHNSHRLIEKASAPYFYLPKLEGHLEARLWNEVFLFAQERLGINRGTIKATVLIETLPAAFEMEEILYELREHSAGLNCGRWDYIFSFMKTFRNRQRCVLPDRDQLTMTQPFLAAYTQLLIRTCHRRGVHAMGGMAAQIPVKGDPMANQAALAKVRADKLREVTDGHDGTWVAHPALVPVAREVFDAHMPESNQLHRHRDDVEVTAADLFRMPEGTRTERGLRHNIRVAVAYLDAWLRGHGCVPLYDLMEDAATAEISRTQVWQWVRHKAVLDDGRVVTAQLVVDALDIEVAALENARAGRPDATSRLPEARALFEQLVFTADCRDFLTLDGYEQLIALTGTLDGWDRQRPTGDGGGAAVSTRWSGIIRPYQWSDVEALRGTVQVRHTLAEIGSRRLWELLASDEHVAALGAMSGNQAMQQVRAGLKAIYVSGWQVAADSNAAGQMYPDQSLYPCDSVPRLVRNINRTLQRADMIDHADGQNDRQWFAPIVADAEAGFGGPLNAFELMKAMIESGAAGVHFEDQLSSAKKCGHLGGKVLVPTRQFIRTLIAARLAADVLDVPTVLIARTDAQGARLLTSDIDPVDRPFITDGPRTAEGFLPIRHGLDAAIARGLAYAPYADVLWCETSTPDLDDARRFAEAIHDEYPGKLLAYNCSPSFNWNSNLSDRKIARFQKELAAMGYRFQFVTLAGFHALNHSMFRLARGYRKQGMSAYASLQECEFADATHGYTAVRHQHEVGTGYFDEVAKLIGGGEASTLALESSTEAAQF